MEKRIPGLFGVLLIFVFLVIGCPSAELSKAGDEPISVTIPAAQQPSGRSYLEEDITTAADIIPLTVGLTYTGGTASTIPVKYQWYRNTVNNNTSGTAIDGATGASYTPPLLELGLGVYYFYVVVTYSDEKGAEKTVTSRVAVITYSDFAITTQPFSKQYGDGEEIAPLTVILSNPDTSRFRFQWYSNTVNSNTGGTAIDGATGISYTPTVSAPGDYYYYVTVTGRGDTAVTITSESATVRILSVSLPSAPTQFTIDDTRYNYVRGVGGTGSFMFRDGPNADASPDADVTYIDKLFGELGCNILRIMVQDDYLNYIENRVQSGNSDVFFHYAKENFFAVIRRANEYGGYVFANPWTAPANMKTGNSLLGSAGGNLKPDSYIAYANHLRNFLKWLNENDAPIFCLGILNEPDWGGQANYEGMGMTGEESRDWFRLVGHFTTQRVINEGTATVGTQQFAVDIIPGYGGGGPTHHVLTMSGDSMGDIDSYMEPQLTDITGPAGTTGQGANNRIEVMGRHYYSQNGIRYNNVVGGTLRAPVAWTARPQRSYAGPYEAESLAASPQMYAPGSTAGNIKREVWQTEHDFNHGSSTVPKNVVTFWNAAFAVMNEIDHTLRIVGESLHDWWFSSSFSGYVTSNHRVGWPDPYTITPRGRAVAHYAKYVNETWLLGVTQTMNVNSISMNRVGTLEAHSTEPKFSAFEDQNGRFISVVMFAPNEPTGVPMAGAFSQGGENGVDDPARGSVNVGRVEIILPDGFTVTGASAIRSWGKNTGQYWQPEPVFMSDDGRAAEATLPGGNIISIKFYGYWNQARSGYPAGYPNN